MFGTGLCGLFFYRAYMYSKSKSQKWKLLPEWELEQLCSEDPRFLRIRAFRQPVIQTKERIDMYSFFAFFKIFSWGEGRGGKLFLWTRAKRRSAALGIHCIYHVWTPVRVNDLWNWVRLLNINFLGFYHSVNQNWP